LFLSFVSFTATAAAAVVSFIHQLDRGRAPFIRQLGRQEGAAEGGTWPMKWPTVDPFQIIIGKLR
jgi:hypothetical protein